MRKLFLSFCMLLMGSTLGSQELLVLNSKYLHTDDSILIFTPRSHAVSDTAHTPLVFLLHGWSGCYRDWSRKMDLQQLSDRSGFIIVCPDGFYNSWYLNDSNSKGMQWRSFFTHELYPQIRDRYKMLPRDCFITGLSMGGHGAINIFIDHPDWFHAAGSMSGVMDLHHVRLKNDYISEVLGEYSASAPRYYTESAINRLELLSASDMEGKLLIVSCGYDDTLFFSSEAFAARCRDLKIPYWFIQSPGKHSWNFWTCMLPLHLKLFDKIHKGENLGY